MGFVVFNPCDGLWPDQSGQYTQVGRSNEPIQRQIGEDGRRRWPLQKSRKHSNIRDAFSE